MTERNQCDGCAVGAPLNIWDHHQMPDGGRMACTAHLYATPAPAQPEAQEEDSLEWKFSCVIDYATGGKLSKPGWALATIKAAIDEHVNALYEEWSEDQDDDEEPDPLHVANERGEGWLPIETAPKDDREFFVGAFVGDTFFQEISHHENPRGPHPTRGWNHRNGPFDGDATLWHPLPAAPKEKT